MKKQSPVLRSVIIITILAISVGIGFIYNSVWHRIDLKLYPREYSSLVEKYSEEYAVPEYIIYAVIRSESNFESGHVGDDGGIGLMGINEDDFMAMTEQTRERLTVDALYGPETNIKYGTYQLAAYYNMLESWYGALSAKQAGKTAAAEWASDRSNYTDDGIFETVPDKDAAKYGKELYECAEKYFELYY